MKKYDWYIAAGIIAAALVWWGIQSFALTETGTEITVSSGGEVIGVYPLAKEDTITVTAEDGGRNVLIIHDGKALMEEADCPDKLCMKQNGISKRGESIICLPHKLTVEVTKGEEAALDAIVQ